MWPSRLFAILKTRGKEEPAINGTVQLPEITGSRVGRKHTGDIRRPNPNCVEPVRPDRSPGLEKTFEGTANVSSPAVDFSPCLPDVVVCELERLLRLERAMA